MLVHCLRRQSYDAQCSAFASPSGKKEGRENRGMAGAQEDGMRVIPASCRALKLFAQLRCTSECELFITYTRRHVHRVCTLHLQMEESTKYVCAHATQPRPGRTCTHIQREQVVAVMRTRASNALALSGSTCRRTNNINHLSINTYTFQPDASRKLRSYRAHVIFYQFQCKVGGLSVR